MISTYLQGGLGNYMFQIAAAEALALDLGVEAIFDFNLSNQVHSNIRTYKNNILSKIKDGNNLTFKSKYYETEFNYNELQKRDNQLLVGYFQSEKYFIHHSDYILNLFSIPNTIINYINKSYGELYKYKTCSIHVRRGDYVELSNHHPLLTMDYYYNAIAIINCDKYIIFSDDIEWCKRNFKGYDFTFIDPQPDYVDLSMMTLCDYNIIANSTFSWWGAWLNKNASKKVVAPLNWFGPAKKNMNTDDIIPKTWTII